MLPKEPDLL